MVIKKHILALAIIGLSSSIMYAQTESNQTQPVDHNFDLQEAISYAKQNSLLLQNSKLDMTNADETVNQIKSAIYPKVTAGIGYNHYLQVPESWIPNFGGTNPEYIKVAFQQKIGMNANVTASQLIFDGAYFLGLKAAREFTKVSSLLYIKSETDLEYQIANAYVQTVGIQSNVTSLESNMATIDSNLRMMNAMYKEGFVEKLDIDKLQLTRSNLKTQKDKLLGMVEVLNNVLKVQLGIPVKDELSLKNSLDDLNQIIMLPELNPDAIKQRIEVQLLDQQLALSKLDEKRYKVGRYPTVAGFVQHQQSTQRPEFNFFQSDLTPNNSFIPSTVVGINVSMTLFDGFQNKSRIREVVNNRTKTENDLENFKRYATLEFSNAKINYQSNLNIWEQQKKNIALAKDIYNRTKIKYQEGVGSALEITQAENDMVSANTSYQTAMNDVILSKIEIKKSLGKKVVE